MSNNGIIAICSLISVVVTLLVGAIAGTVYINTKVQEVERMANQKIDDLYERLSDEDKAIRDQILAMSRDIGNLDGQVQRLDYKKSNGAIRGNSFIQVPQTPDKIDNKE